MRARGLNPLTILQGSNLGESPAEVLARSLAGLLLEPKVEQEDALAPVEVEQAAMHHKISRGAREVQNQR